MAKAKREYIVSHTGAHWLHDGFHRIQRRSLANAQNEAYAWDQTIYRLVPVKWKKNAKQK